MNVAEINPLKLPSLPLVKRSHLPNCPAIYFVLNGTRVLYIGRTINLAQRWLAHHRWQQFSKQSESTRAAWLNLEDTELNLLPGIEAALIEHFRPELNGTALDTPSIMPSNKPRIQIRFSEEDFQYLEQWAESEFIPTTQLCKAIILRAIASPPKKRNRTRINDQR